VYKCRRVLTFERVRYDGAVLGIGNFGRRLVEAAVGLFALLGFVYVPLGRLTGFEHARAVLSTPAASAAIEDVAGGVLALRQRAEDFITGRQSGSGPHRPTEQPPTNTPTEPLPRDRTKREVVRPLPPKLE
jgi:hypothetical protein